MNKRNESVDEVEVMYQIFPEAVGKVGKDLEPYTTKFNDALYMYFKILGLNNSATQEWMIDHGYLEGR